MEGEKYNLEKAEEAEILKNKIESKEASSYSEGEEQLNQKLRENVYKNSIEKDFNCEAMETIDIFKTPLLIRTDWGLLSLLETERRNRITSPGKTRSRLFEETRKTKFWFGSESIYMSLTVPFHIENKEKITAILLKLNPSISKDAIESLIEKANGLGHRYYELRKDKESSDTEKVSDMEKAIEEVEESKFIDELMNNEEYREIWLTMQKHFFTADFKTLMNDLSEEGYYQVDGGMREGVFLINPKAEHAVVKPAQAGGYFFEILGLKEISVGDIKGYVKYPDKINAIRGITDRTPLIKLIEKEANNLFPEKNDLSGLGYIKYPENRKYLAEKLKIDVDSITDDNVMELYENTPGLYAELNRHNSPLLERYPDIDTEKLTIAEIRKDVYHRREKHLKDLFPGVDFSQENVVEGIIKGLSKYITDKYKVDPNQISIKDFMELLVKRMGIPIYDRRGNQLWPEKLNHEEIEKNVSEKDK